MSDTYTVPSKTLRKTVAFFTLFCVSIWLCCSCGISNNSPVIDNLLFPSDQVVSSGSYGVECIASDADGDTLQYVWSATDGTISGDGNTVIWKAPDFSGTYNIEVTVSDGKGGSATSQKSVSVVDNQLPVIHRLTSEPPAIGQGLQGMLRCYAIDPEGGSLVYEWNADTGILSGQGAEVFWTAPDKPGTYSVMVAVIDGNGGKSTTSITIDILPNNDPLITSLKADPAYIVAGKTSTIDCIAYDPDEDGLQYSWQVSVGEILGEGPTVEWEAPADCSTSTCTITVMVSDGRGGEVSKAVKVWVRSSGG